MFKHGWELGNIQVTSSLTCKRQFFLHTRWGNQMVCLGQKFISDTAVHVLCKFRKIFELVFWSTT